MKQWIHSLKIKYPNFIQMLSFVLLSGIATVVDFAVFNALNYWLLSSLSDVDFRWWILDYNAETAGGLAAFLATVFAYFSAQVVNFLVQRRITFEANNNAAASGVMFFIMIVAIWIFQLVMGGVYLNWLNPLFGAFWGGNLSRCLNNFSALLIQYPLNKFVIMRKDTKA